MHLQITSSRELDITVESSLLLAFFPPHSSALPCDSLLSSTCDNIKLAAEAFPLFFFLCQLLPSPHD